MANIRDLMAWMACTKATLPGQPNSVAPFADYLLKTGGLTPFLRKWFIKLLSRDPSEGHYLHFQSRAGRRAQNKAFPLGPISISDLALRERLLAGDFCQVLATYLSEGGELSLYMREWLAKLLKRDTSLSDYLSYKSRPGRRTSVTEILNGMSIDGRAAELHKHLITTEFCCSLVDILNLYRAPIENRPNTQVFRFGVLVLDQWDTHWIKATLTLRTGKTLNTAQIQTIVASQFGVSRSTVKRVVIMHENVRRIA